MGERGITTSHGRYVSNWMSHPHLLSFFPPPYLLLDNASEEKDHFPN